jgi:hypothetical protein
VGNFNSNDAIDLGLLAKISRDYYITPAGIRFILLLEHTIYKLNMIASSGKKEKEMSLGKPLLQCCGSTL